MLTIHAQTSAAEVKKYFDVSDYYTEGQETVGRWGGHLAERLGLSGQVDKLSFERLCDNLNPATGENLTLRTNEFRRVGYDFTFSGPKSFSIVEALAPAEERQRLMAAFDAAIRETMSEVEADLHTRVRKGGVEEGDRRTGNMVWAEFDHSTARPVDGAVPDMHRHRHVFVFNATHDPVEGEIKAGQFKELKHDGEYYAAAFYSRLAHKLEAMGYGIDRRGGRKWEIAGVSQTLIDTFSKRSVEVETEHRNKLDPDHADFDADYREQYKHELAAKTRSKKQKELTPAELRKRWKAQISDGDRNALAKVFAKDVAPGPVVTPEQAVAFAIAHCSEQLSVFEERELKQVALLHGLGSVTIDQIEAELPRHGVIIDVIDGRHMATTETLLAEERYLIGVAGRGRGAVCPVGLAEGLTRTLDDGRMLNDEQWQVTRGLLESSNRLNIFQGPAGAGKSFSLLKLREGIELAGEKVTFLATTAKSVKVLVDDGFADTKTLAHFLLDERMQAAAAGGRIVVDESSMIDHRQAVELFKAAEKHDFKLILSGDKMQHSSVPRGALLRILEQHAGIRSYRLSTIMRQEGAEYRAAAQSLSEGKTLDGFEALDRLQWVHEMGNAQDRYRHVAADYVQALEDKKSVLVVSPTHKEAAAITKEIRSQLRDAGKLGKEDRAFTRLVAVNASEAEKGLATTYQPGDVIQLHQNGKNGLVKGQRITVTDPAALPLAEASKFSLYRPEAVGLAVGDRIRFTSTVATDQGGKLRNGDTHTVAGFTKGGGIRLENGKSVAADCGHWRPAFVETSFGAQGQTVKRVILSMSADSLGATNQEQLYVSATRAKEKLALYTDDKAAVKVAIQNSSQKLAALDLKPKAPGPVSKRPTRLHEHAERNRRLIFFRRYRGHQHGGGPSLLDRLVSSIASRFVPPRVERQREAGLGHER